LFTIPGVQSGTGIVAVPTTSFYGLEQVRSQLELVEALRGSCAGTMDDGRPLFYLTKRERAVSHINLETGESEKRNHWIIHLETAFDLSGVRPTLPAPDDEEPFGE